MIFKQFYIFSLRANAQLSSPKRTDSPSALLGNTKPDANQNRRALRVYLNCLLCEFTRISQVGQMKITLDEENLKQTKHFLWFTEQPKSLCYKPTSNRWLMVTFSAWLSFCFQKLNADNKQRRWTTDKLALTALWVSETHLQPTPKINEATHELLHVLLPEWLKNLSRQCWIADTANRLPERARTRDIEDFLLSRITPC